MVYRVGFSNLDETSDYAITVKESLKKALSQYTDIELIMRDNQHNDELALQHANEFKAMGVDLAIIFHINQRFGNDLRTALFPIPIIALDIPISMTYYFGPNNAQGGRIAGKFATQWVKKNWGGQLDRVVALVDARVLEALKDRITYAVAELTNGLNLTKDQILFLDCANVRSTTIQRFAPLMERWATHHRVLGVGFNAETTLAMLDVVKDQGREQDFVTVGHAADSVLLNELKQPDTRLIASTIYHPERYGELLTPLIHARLHGEHIPIWNYIPIDLGIAQAHQD
ncbi:MAG: sugar ABC transporter substrate-binding protein [Phototrophicaceae bacterium]